ncbi:MAG: 2-oxo acid dehydrogenase subunit E2, partial [Leifsonia sp.]|nr:2-oxo acid dehydrogenase subunit E2 [Leifsonia sp.]
MSSQLTGVGTEDGSAGEFGANEWLVDELYEQFIQDKNSVDKSWWPTLENYHPAVKDDSIPSPGETPAPTPSEPGAPTPPEPTIPSPAEPGIPTPSEPTPPGASEPSAPPSTPAPAAGGAPAPHPNEPKPVTTPIPIIGQQPVARTTSVAPKPQPVPADAPVTAPNATVEATEEDKVTPLRGMSKSLATNMDASLTVPTATSVRTIPAKLLIDNRIVINNHLKRARGGKVSFTHLIGWALIQALKEFPSQNVYYEEVDGKPSVVAPAHINLGIAIDLPKPDGTRALLVPSIKRADTMRFGEYLAAYEDLVTRARNNKLTATDFAGTTISL